MICFVLHLLDIWGIAIEVVVVVFTGGVKRERERKKERKGGKESWRRLSVRE